MNNQSDAAVLVGFHAAMLDRLEANSHKRHWSNLTPRQLLKRCRDEIGELSRAIEKCESPERVLHEAADVANFAMMVADQIAQDHANASDPEVERIPLDGTKY